jgi:DNA-directed RNA polymerase specialized sigma24 family protein
MAETFVIAFRRRGFCDRSRPDARPWLYGITTNLIGQHRKAEARTRRTIAGTGAHTDKDALAAGKTFVAGHIGDDHMPPKLRGALYELAARASSSASG